MIFFYPPKMGVNKKKNVSTFALNRYKLQKNKDSFSFIGIFWHINKRKWHIAKAYYCIFCSPLVVLHPHTQIT